MGRLSLLLGDLAGNPIPQDWAIEDIITANVMMEELDRFSPDTVQVTGSFRRNQALLDAPLTAKIIDDEDGVISENYIDNPQQAIVASDEHTITLQMPKITELMRLSTVGQGWVAGGVQSPLALKDEVARIGSMRYGWSASVVDYGTEPFILRFEDSNLLGALIDTATQTFGHIRQGRDASGAPIRALEIGRFGGAPAIEFISPDGGNANDIVNLNPYARLVETITRFPADATKLVNVVAPRGAGEGTSQVRLRRLFKILYDPTYPHFAATPALLQQYFPEYDGNYPILALYVPTGVVNPTPLQPTLMHWVPARPKKGDSSQWEIAARLDGGADGYEYNMANIASLNFYNARSPHQGEFRSTFDDSTFSYTDSDITNQEYSERALYVATKAQLAWYGFPQKTIQATLVGKGRPPRAGSNIYLNYRRIGTDQQGDFPELDEQYSVWQVVSVARAYDKTGNSIDTATMTNNGQQPPDAASAASNSNRKIFEAIRSVPTTSSSIYPITSGRVKIDATHNLVKYWEIPATAFRVQQAKIRINIFAVRHDVSATDAPALRVDVDIPALQVVDHGIPAHHHTAPIPYHTHSQYVAQHGHGTGVPLHGHTAGTADHGHGFAFGTHSHAINGTKPFIDLKGVGALVKSTVSGTSVVTDINATSATADHTHGEGAITIGTAPSVNAGGGFSINTGGYSTAFNTGDYNSGFYDTLGYSLTTNATLDDNGGQVTGVTTKTSTTGTTVTHGHVLTPGIFETGLPSRVMLAIDNGDGNLVDVSPALGGPWTASMSTSVDFTPLVENSAGKTVRLVVSAVNVSGNPTGLTEVELDGFGVVELSGVASTIYAA